MVLSKRVGLLPEPELALSFWFPFFLELWLLFLVVLVFFRALSWLQFRAWMWSYTTATYYRQIRNFLKAKFSRNALLIYVRSSPKRPRNTSSNFSCKAVTKHPSLSFYFTPHETKAVLKCFCLCRLLFTASPPCLRWNIAKTCEIHMWHRPKTANSSDKSH